MHAANAAADNFETAGVLGDTKNVSTAFGCVLHWKVPLMKIRARIKRTSRVELNYSSKLLNGGEAAKESSSEVRSELD